MQCGFQTSVQKTSLKAGTKALLLLKRGEAAQSSQVNAAIRNITTAMQKDSQKSLLNFLPHFQQTARRPQTWAAVDGRILISDCPPSLVLLLLLVWPNSPSCLATPHSDNLHISPALWKSGNIQQQQPCKITLHDKTELLVNINCVLEDNYTENKSCKYSSLNSFESEFFQ